MCFQILNFTKKYHLDRCIYRFSCLPSVGATAAVLVLGCVAQLIRACWKKTKRNSKKPKILPQNAAIDIVDQIIGHVRKTSKKEKNAVEDEKANSQKEARRTNENGEDEQYRALHEIKGGVKLLVETGYTLLSTAEERHTLSKFIFGEEKKIHNKSDEEAKVCLRTKGHSSRTTALCLDHLQPPGRLKRITSALEQPLNWNWRNCCLVVLFMGALPVVRVTFYLWDFFKDNALVFYLVQQRWKFIKAATCSSSVQGLIITYGVSIVASVLMVCWSIQVTMDNGVIDLNSIKSPFRRRMLRIVLLLLTPISPITIIFKSVRLQMKMKIMAVRWKKNHKESPASAWLEINRLEKKKTKMEGALYQMKSAEANLEGFIQLFVLICFYFVPILLPKVSGLGSEFEENNRSMTSWLLLILSPIFTLGSNVIAIVSSVNMKKGGQLSSVSKCLIGLFSLFQLSSHLLRMVPTVLVSLKTDQEPALDPWHAALVLILPPLVHWCLLITFLPLRIKKFPDRIFHLIR